ncbi:MAG: hypothetical protein ACYS6K_18610 [Planctomycetota bacterium]
MHTQLCFLTMLLCGLYAALAAPTMLIWEMSVKMYSPIKAGALL